MLSVDLYAVYCDDFNLFCGDVIVYFYDVNFDDVGLNWL